MKTTALLSFASILIFGIALESTAGAADIVIRNATILTVTRGTIKSGDLLIQNGKIKASQSFSI